MDYTKFDTIHITQEDIDKLQEVHQSRMILNFPVILKEGTITVEGEIVLYFRLDDEQAILTTIYQISVNQYIPVVTFRWDRISQSFTSQTVHRQDIFDHVSINLVL